MPDVKETKAERIERLKRSKNAWDHLDEIRNFARLGFYSIPPEWLSTYFRTWGVYTQGDGAGVTGGSGGEGRAVPFFMLRIRVPNGLLTPLQLCTIAALSEEDGNGVADITVRQNIQLHWLKIEALPGVFERLESIGLRTTGACGDVVRNITGCPLAGLDAHEIVDVSPVALALDKELGGNPDFYNLPRKFKITVTGCPQWCSYPEINDISFTAVRRPVAQAFRPEAFPSRSAQPRPDVDLSSSTSLTSSPSFSSNSDIGFSLRIAGGLSTEPHLAVKLNAFIRWDQVLPVARAIAEVFRTTDILRQSRDKAR